MHVSPLFLSARLPLLIRYKVSDQIRGADSAPNSSWMQRKRAEAKKSNPVAL